MAAIRGFSGAGRRGTRELVVIVRAKELCGYVLTITDKSPKKFRFTLVSRLQNYALDAVESLYKANLVRVRGREDAARMEERRELQRQAYACVQTLGYLALELNEKTQIVPISQGVDYLGFHLYLTDTGKVVRRLRTSNKRRMRRKLKRFRHAWREGKVTTEDVARSLQSYRAHLARGDCWRLEQNLLRHLVLSRSTQDELARDREHPHVPAVEDQFAGDATSRGMAYEGFPGHGHPCEPMDGRLAAGDVLPWDTWQ
ncbi:MAG: four helix bundle protein [Atopobiaceae bacterium]|nr:four helix bundle protein [Atopobiaceae bacterium]